ncbi:MAG: hypothetical protein JST92_06865 [Deltaproteobacteria bacterium]|nr:hypothetical protein [Deltaproteobacteria bacterium]
MPKRITEGKSPWLAERHYHWHPPSGPPRLVTLCLGPPHQTGGDWACRVNVTGLEVESDQLVHGMDALQALELGIEFLALTLTRSKEHRAGRITLFDVPLTQPKPVRKARKK